MVTAVTSTEDRRARFVYEAGRLYAATVGAPVVPAPWEDRDDARRAAVTAAVAPVCRDGAQATAEEGHALWSMAVEAEGWTYGTEYDPEAKTHPCLVPWADLDPREQAKDLVFLRLCEIARLTIT